MHGLRVLVLGMGWLAAAMTQLPTELLKNPLPTFEDHLYSLDGAMQRVAQQFVPLESLHQSSFNLYSRAKRADRLQEHQLVFAIKGKNMDELEALVHDISDPESLNYGNHLKTTELLGMTANHESADHVQNYLQQLQGVQEVCSTLSGDFVVAKAPVYVWEQVLRCEFHEYELKAEHESSRGRKVRVVRTSEYFVEQSIAAHVTAVFNTLQFPPPPPPASLRSPPLLNARNVSRMGKEALQLVNGYVTPDLLVKTYGIDSSLGNNKVNQAVYESLDQTFSPADLNMFQNYFSLPVNDVAQVIGGHSDDQVCAQYDGYYCAEGNLDVQYIMSTAPHVPTIYYYWAGQDFMVDWLVEVSNMANPPEVISISYGMDEMYVTPAYASAFNTQALKLAALGVTLVASAGDDGATGAMARGNLFYCGYRPIFPASSPYVLAVGGTMGPEKSKSETACQGDLGGVITTGGGFSTLYPTPAFQESTVASYFKASSSSTAKPVDGYNKGGRGYPDISALAANYLVFINQQLVPVSGTSASAPVMAGMLSLVNAARQGAGKGTLGWVNPALYKYASTVTKDISSGNNLCTAGGLVCCGQGFAATAGWDPVTGLGVVNFASFKSQLVSIGVVTSPSRAPTRNPSKAPKGPSRAPSKAPTGPTKTPTRIPSPTPTRSPTAPTLSPTRAPSSAPSTSAPTTSAGWLSISQYSSQSCVGQITMMSSIPTNHCQQLYSPKNKVVGSRKLLCGGDGARMVMYSDSLCSESKVTQKYEIFYGCASKVSNAYSYSDRSYYSASISCSSDSVTLPPIPSQDGKYAAQTSFDSLGGCDSGKVSKMDTVLQGYCFSQPDYSMSFFVSFPQMTFFDGTTCDSQQVIQALDLATTCTPLDIYYYGGVDEVALSWSLIGTPPSSPPSSNPSSSHGKGGVSVGSWVWIFPFLLCVGIAGYFYYKSKHPAADKKLLSYKALQDSNHSTGAGRTTKNLQGGGEDPDDDLL